MTDTVIARLDQVTVAWLITALERSGVLTRGSVASFEAGTGQGNWSTNANLLVKYSDDAQGSLPKQLFLKMVNTDLGDESFGASEVDFYTRDYVDVEDAPLLRCYDAAYSNELKRYHLLLDDVSATHIEAAQKTPTLEYGLALAEALAILHARWWGAQRLTDANAPIHDEIHIRAFVDIARPGADHIIERVSTELKPHWPNAIYDLYARHPQALVRRARDLNGFTHIHGDVGDKNILVPRHADVPVYIIDRQPFNWSLTTWLGVYDLAYAIVLDWPTELRRQCELPILRRYHDCLIDHAVSNYSWEQLYDDYRLCVPMCVYIAIEYCRGGVNERSLPVWLPMLQKSLTACDDLQCSALWEVDSLG